MKAPRVGKFTNMESANNPGKLYIPVVKDLCFNIYNSLPGHRIPRGFTLFTASELFYIRKLHITGSDTKQLSLGMQAISVEVQPHP